MWTIFRQSIASHSLGGGLAAFTLDTGLAASLPAVSGLGHNGTKALGHDAATAAFVWSCGYALALCFLAWVLVRGLPEAKPITDDDDEDIDVVPSARGIKLPNRKQFGTAVLLPLSRLIGSQLPPVVILVALVSVGLLPLPGAALVAACACFRLLPSFTAVLIIAVISVAKPFAFDAAVRLSAGNAVLAAIVGVSNDSLRFFDGREGFIFSRAPLPLNTVIVVTLLLLTGTLMVTSALP